jgi:hypothetical protein
MRLMKTIMVGALGLSMASAPVLAQSAAPLSVSAVAEGDSGGSSDMDDYLLPGLVIMAVIAAAILLTGDENDDFGNPTSP